MSVDLEDSDDATFALPATTVGAQSSLAVSLARAEVDQQITTARAYPRSVTRAVQNILTLATIDEHAAADCVYALPRGGKPIKGPSVRLAEIVASQWQNCRVGARVVIVNRAEKYIEAEGVFHDLENNVATTARVQRRIVDSKGRLYSDDMIIVTGNAACAIAKRNAILGGVPRAAWGRAYDAAISVVAGDVKTLAERRERALKAFGAFGVTPDRVFAALGVAGPDDITLAHMPTLIAMHSALKSGEATVEEMFSPAAQVKRNLAADLDLGAESVPAEKPAAPAPAPEPPHDPETGEVVQEVPAGPQAAPAPKADEVDAGDRPAPAPAADQDEKFAALLSTARAAATNGTAALLRHLNKLHPDSRALLDPHVVGLKAAAKAADKEGGQ